MSEGIAEANIRYFDYDEDYFTGETTPIGPAVCDRLCFKILEDDVVRCRLEFAVFQDREAVDGEEISYNGEKIFGYGELTPERTKIVEFNFSFTTDDSDVAIFEPHIDHFRRWFNFEETTKLEKKIRYDQTTNFRDVTKNRNEKKRTSEIREYYDPLIRTCSSKDIERFMNFLKEKTRMNMRAIGPIARTIVNAMVRLKIESCLPAVSKGCPHMSR